MGFGESGADLNLNLNSSLTSGSGSDGEDYGIEKLGWGRNQASFDNVVLVLVVFVVICFDISFV